ncbi:hypothetical protein cypCar_00028796 [Cyprinus carpio]|nr:hypothetical protein cypCar_00028796 [Cyprinus carpio]
MNVLLSSLIATPVRLQDKCVGNSCYPNLGELMASSTCGLYRPQNYCILGYLEVHGRCVCQHSTAGYNCERCQYFYHDAPWRPGGKTDSDVCRTCDCDPDGSVCVCKQNVEEECCDRCKFGFYWFSRDDPSGCQCYWGLGNTVYGCLPCDCDIGGALRTETTTLDLPVCLSDGNKYHVDVTFRKKPNADPQTSSYILIDSMGLISKVDSLPNCSQSYLAQFQQYHCIELGAQAGQQTLPEVCEKLIGTCDCNIEGTIYPACDPYTGEYLSQEHHKND